MRYIGSKRKLVDIIEEFVYENIPKKIKNQNLIFCDIFSGTGVVAEKFQNKYRIIANDIMTFSNVILNAKFKLQKKPHFTNFKKKYKKEILEHLNELSPRVNSNYFITLNYSPFGKTERMYFSVENAKKIDSIRHEIDELYREKTINKEEFYYLLYCLLDAASRVSNTTGTYGAYLKKWDPRALKKMKIEELDVNCFKNNKENKIFSTDANMLVKEIKGNILYIDPPYTTVDYSSAYHILETIATYDKPEIHGITGTRKINKKRSKYSKKTKAEMAFENLIKFSNFDYIFLSYSNHGIISIDRIKEILKKYSIDKDVIIKEINYREYANVNKTAKEKLKEYLFFIKKGSEYAESPLNYSGGKFKILPYIINSLPDENINKFVDLFAGGFNVGANVHAERIIYNDINYFAKDLIKTIRDKKGDKIIKYVDENIKKFGLNKKNKANFYDFRNYYNNFPIEERNPLDLLTLIIHTYQHQIRFNSSHGFNNPYGTANFNDRIRRKILRFSEILDKKKIIFSKYSFDKFPIENLDGDDFVYLDPPYFITTATYNDGKRGFDGWAANHEYKLYEFIDQLNSKNVRFMLSNIIEHKNKTNVILKEFLKERDYFIFEIPSKKRKEIIVTNFITEYMKNNLKQIILKT